MHTVIRRQTAIVLLLLLFLGRAYAAELLSPESLIAKYGAPDSIESTEYDRPRPVFVTKLLTYKREGVQFIFMADAPINAPPPYKKYGLVGAIDPRRNVNLTVDEVVKRMSKRLSK